ncbi:MAG TPA: cytochrome P450 [Longimicrobiales bacterium]
MIRTRRRLYDRTDYEPRRHARPPGPRPQYPGQLIRALATDRLGLFAEMARHGDVAQISIRARPVVLLNHPDDIRRMLVTEQRSFVKGPSLGRLKLLLGNGLLTNEGESHLRQRRLVQPAFHRERLATYAGMMTEYAERTGSRWRHGETLDVHEEMMRLTLAVAARAFFDADVEGDAHYIGEALDLSLRLFGYAILPLGSLIQYAPLPWVRDLRRARARTEELIQRLIRERRARGEDRGDLLSILIAARDTAGDGGGMTDRQLRDEIVTLMMAGHETTANALTWSWLLLSRHPHVETKLHAEIDRVLGDRPPEVSDLPKLTYTRSVLAEALRLYPPAWILERQAVADFEAGGYTIRRGSLLLASQYLVHRDPRWWPDPERFEPERWLTDAPPSRPKFAYFPFGGGTRICVGEHFAWMEGTLVLATLARRWHLRFERPTDPEPEPLVTLRPKGGLPMRALARRPPHAHAGKDA